MGAHGAEVADTVRSAVLRSLHTDGVRIYRLDANETKDGWATPWSWQIGVASPRTRAARVRIILTEASAPMKLAAAAARRWPWLEDNDDDGADDEPAEVIEIGAAKYYGGPDRWLDWTHHHTDPRSRVLWPLETILGLESATRLHDADVRDATCACYRGTVRTPDAPPAADARLEDGRWSSLLAEVCIDDAGLVRRVAITATTGERFRPGILLRLVAALSREDELTSGDDRPWRPWHFVELWDYGHPVEITAPTAIIDRSGASMRDVVRAFWRMRRDDRRRQR